MGDVSAFPWANFCSTEQTAVGPGGFCGAEAVFTVRRSSKARLGSRRQVNFGSKQGQQVTD